MKKTFIGLAMVRTLCVVFALAPCVDLHGGTPGVSSAQIGNPAVDQSWVKELEDHGLTLFLEWDADIFINARGGKSQDAVTDGLVKLGLDIDGQKLTGLALLSSTEIHVEEYYPYGTNISVHVGDLAGVNGNAAYNSPRLYELWFQKSFQVGPVVNSFRIGLMGADQEFDVNSTADWFINTSFGAPLALGGNAPVPVYPFTALGVRLELSVGDDKDVKLTLRSGVFDGNSAAPTLGPLSVGAPASLAYNKYGVDFHLNPGTGLIFLNELVFDFLNREPPGIPPPGPGRWFFGPGHFLIGGFYATNRFDNIYQERLRVLGLGTSLQAVGTESGDYGVYVLWEQKIYEAAPVSPEGLYLFARGLVLPKDRNFDTVSAEAGAVYKGVFRRQKDLRDSIGIGFAYNSISDNVRRADDVARQEGVPKVPNLRFESVLETTYAFPITAHWQLQPDFQWVIRPGASNSLRDAVVIGLRSTLTF
jgi:porin